MVCVGSSWHVRLMVFACVMYGLLGVCPMASGSLVDGHDLDELDGSSLDLENHAPRVGYAELLDAVASLDEEVEWVQPIFLDQTSETTPKPKPTTGQKVTLPTKQPASPKPASDPVEDIEAFSKKFRRSYIDAATKEKRKQILAANLKLAQAKNAKSNGITPTSRSKAGGSLQPSHVKTKHDGAGPARFGVTRFSDLTPQEFKLVFNTAKVDYSKIKKAKPAPKSTKNTAAKPTTTTTKTKATSAAKTRFAAVESEAEEGQPPPPPPKVSPGAGRVLETGAGAFTATFHTNDHNHLQRYYTNDEIAAIRAQSKVVPSVSYTKLNELVDQPVDWSGLSPVVRDIGACGACWAATAADLLQTSLFRATGKPSLQFSSQFLIDCDKAAMGSSVSVASQLVYQAGSMSANTAAFAGANAGCMGGSVQNSVRFMRSKSSPIYAPGQNYFEKDYGALLPPTDWMTMQSLPIPPCRDSHPELRQPVIDDFSYVVFPTAYQALRATDVAYASASSEFEYPGYPSKALGAPGSPTATVDREVLLAQGLNKWGPLGVTIDASQLMNYKSGIIDSTMCSSDPTVAQHQALLVGLASSGAQQYWVVKNSWGEDWGVNGYMYIARGSNTCSITSSVIRFNVHGDASDPVVTDIEALWTMFTAKGLNH